MTGRPVRPAQLVAHDLFCALNYQASYRERHAADPLVVQMWAANDDEIEQLWAELDRARPTVSRDRAADVDEVVGATTEHHRDGPGGLMEMTAADWFATPEERRTPTGRILAAAADDGGLAEVFITDRPGLNLQHRLARRGIASRHTHDGQWVRGLGYLSELEAVRLAAAARAYGVHAVESTGRWRVDAGHESWSGDVDGYLVPEDGAWGWKTAADPVEAVSSRSVADGEERFWGVGDDARPAGKPGLTADVCGEGTVGRWTIGLVAWGAHGLGAEVWASSDAPPAGLGKSWATEAEAIAAVPDAVQAFMGTMEVLDPEELERRGRAPVGPDEPELGL